VHGAHPQELLEHGALPALPSRPPPAPTWGSGGGGGGGGGGGDGQSYLERAVMWSRSTSAAAADAERSPATAPAPAPATAGERWRPGERCFDRHSHGMGTVRYVGKMQDRGPATYVGVELDEATGSHDGAVFGSTSVWSWFDCSQGRLTLAGLGSAALCS
jgi:hypothetical protein